jgi:hypothetical protein
MTTPLAHGSKQQKRAKRPPSFDLHQKHFSLMATRKATMPPLKPIRNEAEYRAALAALSRFFDSNPDAASQESSTTKH